MTEILEQYRAEMVAELDAILYYWATHMPDSVNGGFLGRIDCNEKPQPGAPKGAVLNSRILWAFAAAARLTGNTLWKEQAARAYDYITRYFIDAERGGVYWTVDYTGKPLDTKKQVYALAFAVYGLSEWYRTSGTGEARSRAISIYHDIVRHSYDPLHGGYTEAFTRDWGVIDDLRLSEKDANEKKTMNTHLHILEAFTNLYRTWPDGDLRSHIAALLQNFTDHIINPQTHHLKLFFDEQWRSKSQVISYGHDIEAAWLLLEAAEVIDDHEQVRLFRQIAVQMANAVMEGIDSDGGLWHEYDPARQYLVKEKHSWPQAEAMTGFFNVWQLTHDDKYLNASLAGWRFVRNHIHDTQHGEWYWGIDEKGKPVQEDKAGLWKCPYHNSRACMEIISRITRETGLLQS